MISVFFLCRIIQTNYSMKYFEFFKMLEKKDHLIRKTNLTGDQKQIAIDFFTRHPNYEKELGTKWDNPEIGRAHV